MVEIIPNWHPLLVHFTVALFSIATLLMVLSKVLGSEELRGQMVLVAKWNLWLGALITLFTLGSGLYAYYTVDHDSPSHLIMIEHRNLALLTALLFISLAVWVYTAHKKAKGLSTGMLAMALIASTLLAATAWHGGELVYRHGIGVLSLPEAHGKGHDHQHGSAAAHGHGAIESEGADLDGESNHHDELSTDLAPPRHDHHDHQH